MMGGNICNTFNTNIVTRWSVRPLIFVFGMLCGLVLLFFDIQCCQFYETSNDPEESKIKNGIAYNMPLKIRQVVTRCFWLLFLAGSMVQKGNKKSIERFRKSSCSCSGNEVGKIVLKGKISRSNSDTTMENITKAQCHSDSSFAIKPTEGFASSNTLQHSTNRSRLEYIGSLPKQNMEQAQKFRKNANIRSVSEKGTSNILSLFLGLKPSPRRRNSYTNTHISQRDTKRMQVGSGSRDSAPDVQGAVEISDRQRANNFSSEQFMSETNKCIGKDRCSFPGFGFKWCMYWIKNVINKYFLIDKTKKASVSAMCPSLQKSKLEAMGLWVGALSLSFFGGSVLLRQGDFFELLECVYILALTLYHIGEYTFIFLCHPCQLGFDCFLLNDTRVYTIVLILQLTEAQAKLSIIHTMIQNYGLLHQMLFQQYFSAPQLVLVLGTHGFSLIFLLIRLFLFQRIVPSSAHIEFLKKRASDIAVDSMKQFQVNFIADSSSGVLPASLVALRENMSSVPSVLPEKFQMSIVESWQLAFFFFIVFVSCSGAILCFSGWLLRIFSFATLSENFTHLIRTGKISEHKLITYGPYRLSRHPAYAGWFWWAIGSQILLINLGCLVLNTAVCLVFFSKRINYEEEMLLKLFGQDYEEYRRTVPRIG